MYSQSEDKRVWKRKEILSLIQMYESLPELWNTNCNDYKERKKKQAAIMKICEAFGAPSDEIRRKIHNLRCQFNAELRKIKKKSLEHGIDENIIFSEWTYFDHLKFLKGMNTGVEKKPLDNTDRQNSSESDESDYDLEEPNTSKVVTQKIIKPEKIYLSNTEHIMPRPLAVPEDDHRVFGEYVASELRGLNERNAKKLKLLIRKAILEVTEEEYNMENVEECDFKGYD